jgi:acetylornithine/succinyldiaminopimelate/putrescine aminotransferase
VAHHVVGRVAQPEFLAGVAAKGRLLRDLLAEINSPHLVEIRGRGLMVGLELDVAVAPVVSRGYDEGLLLVNAGPNVLRFVPPLVISEAEIHLVAERLTRALQAL